MPPLYIRASLGQQCGVHLSRTAQCMHVFVDKCMGGCMCVCVCVCVCVCAQSAIDCWESMNGWLMRFVPHIFHLVTCSCTLSAFCCMASRMALKALWCFCLLPIAPSSSFSICLSLSQVGGNYRTSAIIFRRWISLCAKELVRERITAYWGVMPWKSRRSRDQTGTLSAHLSNALASAATHTVLPILW